MARRSFFVVGHKGMLGHDVVQWLRQHDHAVETTDSRFGAADDDPLIADVAASAALVVINCAAALPGRRSDGEQWLANALLPIRLASILTRDQWLIHASTDGVFSGSKGQYRVEDAPDALDSYGWSKRAGEWAVQVPGVVVIRTSIVGTSAGLLGWLLGQTGAVEAFVNHRWSGVTTAEWASRCLEIVEGGERRSRIEHLASPPTSKFHLLEAAARIFGLAIDVRPVAAPLSLDRTLVPTIATRSIEEQLADLRKWSNR